MNETTFFRPDTIDMPVGIDATNKEIRRAARKLYKPNVFIIVLGILVSMVIPLISLLWYRYLGVSRFSYFVLPILVSCIGSVLSFGQVFMFLNPWRGQRTRMNMLVVSFWTRERFLWTVRFALSIVLSCLLIFGVIVGLQSLIFLTTSNDSAWGAIFVIIFFALITFGISLIARLSPMMYCFLDMPCNGFWSAVRTSFRATRKCFWRIVCHYFVLVIPVYLSAGISAFFINLSKSFPNDLSVVLVISPQNHSPASIIAIVIFYAVLILYMPYVSLAGAGLSVVLAEKYKATNLTAPKTD